MAIKNRHGIYDKFVPEKLVPGEFAFVRSGDPNAKDGKAIYASFDAGTTKRLATYEDMKENIELAADDVVNEVAEELNAATDRANTSAVEAETAATNATNAAEEAKHAIAGSKSPVYKSDGWPEVGEEGRLYIDDTVSPRLIYTWDDEKGYVKTGGSGGGSATVEEMTWAEYEALSEEEKMDGTLRVITDKKAGVRFGNVDISDIGDGTVTGAISNVNASIKKKNDASILAHCNPIPITPYSGVNHSDGSYYAKIGTRVILNLSVGSLNTSGANTVFEMPVGYRPMGKIETVMSDGTANGTSCPVTISQYGTISVYTKTGYCIGYIEYEAFL